MRVRSPSGAQASPARSVPRGRETFFALRVHQPARRHAVLALRTRPARLPPPPSSSFGGCESSPDMVIAVDRSGLIIYYNDGAEKGLGYTAAEVIGQSVGKLYPSMQEAHRVMAAMRSDEHGGPGKVKNFETIFVTRWGEHIPVAISGSILSTITGSRSVRSLRQGHPRKSASAIVWRHWRVRWRCAQSQSAE